MDLTTIDQTPATGHAKPSDQNRDNPVEDTQDDAHVYTILSDDEKAAFLAEWRKGVDIANFANSVGVTQSNEPVHIMSDNEIDAILAKWREEQVKPNPDTISSERAQILRVWAREWAQSS